MIFKHFRIYKNICFCRHSSSLSTIFALATGPQLRSGVAIIRVSGSLATQSLLKLTRETKLEKFKPKQLYVEKIYHHKTNDLIDQCMTVWFKGPKSFTGEDVVEFHIHGSKAVVGAIFSALSSFPNYRLAEPGEFSKRAYLNGRLDLTEAEGLIDLINAQTEQQRKQSLYQMQGSLKELYERWRLDLVKSLAHAEAYIDFHEDQHIENDILSDVINTVKTAYNAMSIHLQDQRRGEILRDGCRIAILGAPNAGKSSLLNILTQKPTAIVSPIAGTTRDVIESTIDLGGYPIVICDTAGLRITDDPIENEGVLRAVDRANTCDLLIIVVDINMLSLHDNLNEQIDKHLSDLFTIKSSSFNSLTKLILLNKIDLTNENIRLKFQQLNDNIIPISCTSGVNIEEFLSKLTKSIAEKCTEPSFTTPYLTNERHRMYLARTVDDLSMFLTFINNNQDLVLAVEYLRLAIRSLGTVTGVVYTEELLDVIFRDFCIGK
ncbi:unnamed protein product [Rotaria socialis]|uniref:TrmE-type G domain-containing protein n=1 Tax=Rotaria socialis TaxID=392032 RepID=A0A817W413_9BILA|nr:unnamed protein product [Rotaria socialis]CAF3350706.1 unnamed protein product [Rotaria socialis]CAF3391696.1 unnamed protein product [Rotaria socialis]CAF3754443.1 unnamed protein product [Rotaria socialis]